MNKGFSNTPGNNRKANKKFGSHGEKRDGRPFKKNDDKRPKPFSGKPSRPFAAQNDADENGRPPRRFEKPSFGKDKKTERKGGEKPRKPLDSRPFRDREQPVFGRKSKDGKPSDKPGGVKPEEPRTFSDVVKNVFNEPRKKKDEKAEDHPGKRQQFEDKVYGELAEPEESSVKKPYEKNKKRDAGKQTPQQAGKRRWKKYKDDDEEDDDAGPQREDMPLNKFIAHSGECSRRDAAELVKQGKVKVNGELVIDPGHRVTRSDNVTLSGKKLTPGKGFVYVLLNKPKGYITTNDDPQGRRTVMELVSNAGGERLFPVGRLDRDTTGLLLLTNDGELTQRLCHPSFNIKKVYHVTLDRPLTMADFEKIMGGLELEDGKAVVDEMAYLEKKNELGLEIHSGKNRIVRRIFESLGYVVEKLDRMMYAGLTKKNLPRGKWRHLTPHEAVLLKHFKNS